MCMLPLAEISSRTRPFASRYSNMRMDICPSSCPCLHLHQYVCERGWRSSEMHMHIHGHTGATGPSTSTLEHGVGQRSVFGDGRRSSARRAHGASRNHCSRTRKHARTHTCKRKRAHTYVRTRKRRCETSTQTGGPNPTSRRQALLSQYSSLQQAAEDRPCRLLPRQ